MVTELLISLKMEIEEGIMVFHKVGKTRLVENIIQDIRNGKNVVIIDPKMILNYLVYLVQKFVVGKIK
jgi:hypothetical protein